MYIEITNSILELQKYFVYKATEHENKRIYTVRNITEIAVKCSLGSLLDGQSKSSILKYTGNGDTYYRLHSSHIFYFRLFYNLDVLFYMLYINMRI